MVNESMANGCAVISSNVIGSTGYLVKEGRTGFSFNNLNSDSLTEKAKWLLKHPAELEQMKSKHTHKCVIYGVLARLRRHC